MKRNISLALLWLAGALPPLAASDHQSADGRSIFADTFRVDYTLASSGEWADWGRESEWSLTLESPGASSMSVFISRLSLPDGSVLTLEDDGRNAVIASAGNAPSQLRTWPVAGESMILRLRLPTNQRRFASLEIDELYAGIPGRHQPIIAPGGVQSKNGSGPTATSGPGVINYECVAQQRDDLGPISRATASVIIRGAACTGALINHDNADNDPWLLTASHCADNPDTGFGPENSADRVAVRWNLITPCGEELGSVFSGTQSSRSGVETVYSDSGADGTATVANDIWVIRLNDYPDVAERAYVLGYSGSTPKIGDELVSITHAAALNQQFLRSTVAAIGGGQTGPDGPQARVSDRVRGEVIDGEALPGSSGSSAIDRNGRTTGVLSQGGGTIAAYNPLSEALPQMQSRGLLTLAEMPGREAPAPRATPPPTSTPTPTPEPPAQSGSSGGGSPYAPFIIMLLGAWAARRWGQKAIYPN